MVLKKVYEDLINETSNNIPSGSLTLPSSKQPLLIINFEDSTESNPVYSGGKPILPFAQSDIIESWIKGWRKLTSESNPFKPIYEIELDISDKNITYEPGDTIGIIPKNNESDVKQVIEHLGLKSIENSQYTLSIDGQKGKIPLHVPVKSTIKYVLTHCVDLRGVVKKLFLLALSKHTKDESERNILQYLCSKEGSSIYSTHILNKNINIVDILNIFKSCKPPIEVLFEHLPRLLPRPYSIVNSGNVDQNSIKICFSVLDIGGKKGLTTGWLEEIILNDTIDKNLEKLNLNENTNRIPIYLRKNMNNFKLPEDSKKPIILIGIGSGISPYIGFLQEREYLKEKLDIELGFAWMFYGCRNPKWDFIYEKELQGFLDNGVLNKLSTAFSRLEESDCKYVQDAILQNGEEVTNLLKDGAVMYICGDVKVMATQIKETLVKCVASSDNIEEKEAEIFVNEMTKEKRLLIDVWN